MKNLSTQQKKKKSTATECDFKTSIEHQQNSTKQNSTHQI
jgi:hypothetical protein